MQQTRVSQAQIGGDARLGLCKSAHHSATALTCTSAGYCGARVLSRMFRMPVSVFATCARKRDSSNGGRDMTKAAEEQCDAEEERQKNGQRLHSEATVTDSSQLCPSLSPTRAHPFLCRSVSARPALPSVRLFGV